MILTTSDIATYNESYNYWLTELRDDMNKIRQREIRKQFDAAILDSQAKACITMAKELGYAELATEMENDLQTELSCN